MDISNGSTIKDSTIQAALSHLEVEEIIQLGDLQSFNMDIVKIAHADIQQSRIKGNVTVGYGLGYNGQTVSIKNNSELVSFESDGEEYLRDGKFKRGEVVGITVATGFNLDKAKIYGKVGLLPFGNAGSYYLIQNSILNGLNTDETSGVSVSGVSIKNSSLVNSDSLKMTVQGSSIFEGSEIVNIRAENTTLLGAFVSLDNANVSISDSFLSANINFSGNNNIQHLNFRLAGASANQFSSFSNTNITGYSLGNEKCNSINGTAEVRNANIYCSKIASNENKLQNVNIQNSELTFSSVTEGNVIDSMLYGGAFNGLELLESSTLHAREGQFFDYLSLSNSYVNLTNLSHGFGSASFENATIYGTGKLSIPENYAFKDVVIFVDSLVLEQNSLLDGVQISGGGEVVIQESASIKNSSLSTDPGGDDPIILVQNGVEISDSRIMGNVIVEEGAKILLNSKVLNSQIREKATVNYSYIIESELEANSKATELSQIVSSRIESNIEVVNSDIGYIELNESIVGKTCRPSGFEVFVCEDGVDIEEWEPFEFHPSATILSNIN